MADSDTSASGTPEDQSASSTTAAQRTPLWTLKATQLLGTAAAACVYRYITVYYSMIGLNRFNIGLLSLLGPLSSFVGQLFWGEVVDRTGEYKKVFVFGLVTFSITLYTLLLDVVQKSLPLLIIVTITWYFLASTTGSIVDALCLQVLKERTDTDEDYGDQRLWSAVGWGGMSLILGQLVDTWGIPCMFVGATTIQAINLMIILVWIPSPERTSDRSSVQESGASSFRALCTFDVAWFLLNLLQYGMAMALVENFLLVFLLEDFDNTPTFLLGASVATMCLFEVPVFKYVGRLWTQYGFDLTCVISMCQLILVLRLVLYTLLPRRYPWLVLLIEPLHGITFGAMWAASVEYGQQLAPTGSTAKMQGLVQGIYYQVAMGLGALLWGALVQKPPRGFGFKRCFWIDTLCVLLWCATWQICLRIKGRLSRGRAARQIICEPSATTSLQQM